MDFNSQNSTASIAAAKNSGGGSSLAFNLPRLGSTAINELMEIEYRSVWPAQNKYSTVS